MAGAGQCQVQAGGVCPSPALCANTPAPGLVYPYSVVNNGSLSTLVTYAAILGSLQLSGQSGITTISLPVLTFVGANFIFANDSSLASIAASVLTYIGGALQIDSQVRAPNNAISAVQLPLLRVVQ